MWRSIIMLCGLFLLVGGMYHAYSLLRNTTPQQMTVAEFLGSDDHHLGAVLLTDARLNLLKAIVITKGKENRVNKLYLPIESRKSQEFAQEDRVSLLLDTSDARLLNIASKFYRMSKKEQMSYIVHHKQDLLQETELVGLMLDRHSMRASRLQEIRTVVPRLADDFFVLRHQAKVSLVRSLVISLLGLFILIFGLFREVKRADSRPA